MLANSHGVKNSLDLAVKYEAKFFHFSSSVVYGINQDKDVRISEDYIGKVDMLSERGVYDEGKRFAEVIVKTYVDKYAVDARIGRIFRVYGPRMPLGDNQMLPDFIYNTLDLKSIMNIKFK